MVEAIHSAEENPEVVNPDVYTIWESRLQSQRDRDWDLGTALQGILADRLDAEGGTLSGSELKNLVAVQKEAAGLCRRAALEALEHAPLIVVGRQQLAELNGTELEVIQNLLRRLASRGLDERSGVS